MTKTPVKPNYHFLIGTPGALTIHCNTFIKEGDTLVIANKKFEVTKIKHEGDSRYYPGLHYYELNFKLNN